MSSELHHWRKGGSVDALGVCQPGPWLRICTSVYRFEKGVVLCSILKKVV